MAGSGLTDRASAAATPTHAHYPTFLRAEAAGSCMRLLGGVPPAILPSPLSRFRRPRTLEEIRVDEAPTLFEVQHAELINAR